MLKAILDALAWAFLPYLITAVGAGLVYVGDRHGVDVIIWAGMAIALVGLIWIALRWLFGYGISGD